MKLAKLLLLTSLALGALGPLASAQQTVKVCVPTAGNTGVPGCQDVTSTNPLPGTTTITGSLPAGTNSIGTVGLNAGTNAIGSVTVPPSSAAAVGITPVVSGSLEASHVLKNAAGNLYAVYASNLTGGTTGLLQVFNATSAPADGAVTPIVCVPFNSMGEAAANYVPGPPAVFSTGITAVISSSTTCFTKTTGVLTGFISGLPQ